MKSPTVLLVVVTVYLYGAFADENCPMDLDYVRQLPWDKSSCKSANISGIDDACCNTLRSLFGVGIAQYLRDTSMFGFPSNASAVSCLGLFQQQLDTLGLSPDLASICWKNRTSEFVSSPSLCAGIQTKQDWIRKVDITSVDSACEGDLSDRTVCGECYVKLSEMYASNPRKGTKCIYFTLLYVAGVVNKFGPKSRGTADCILRLPFAQTAQPPFVQTAQPPFVQTTSDHGLGILAYALLGAVPALLICALGLLRCLWVRKRNSKAVHRGFVRRNEELMKRFVKPNTAGSVWFGIEEIKTATDDFSDANLIGQGGFATVYKGMLPDGRRIAVKRMRNCTPEGDSEFMNEVEVINNIRHRNLVVLRGFCVASDESEGHQRFLIYDYMSNGSLDDHIFGGMPKTQPLSWSQLRNIALGTAKGLAYLHDGIKPAIYHRDIKPNNILLDDELNACVADFGLARIMTKEGESYWTAQIAGTHGYLAPEYALYGKLTDKSDVYSFGVLLLVIMSGRKALDNSVVSTSEALDNSAVSTSEALDNSAVSTSYRLITDWAWALVKNGRTGEIIDKRIWQSELESVMKRFVLVGILCAHNLVAFRPRMVEAVKMLEGEAEIPEIGDMPWPLMHDALSTLYTYKSRGSFVISESDYQTALQPVNA